MLWSRRRQMFKDAEKGDKEVNIERTEEALETQQTPLLWVARFV